LDLKQEGTGVLNITPQAPPPPPFVRGKNPGANLIVGSVGLEANVDGSGQQKNVFHCRDSNLGSSSPNLVSIPITIPASSGKRWEE